MKIEFELIPPTMPNYVRYKQPPQTKEQGFKADAPGIDIAHFNEDEAMQFAELMKDEFLRHWNERRKNKQK